MKLFNRLSVAAIALIASLAFSGHALAQADKKSGKAGATAAPKAPVQKAAAAGEMSDKQIVDAKAKGLVWVNTDSKIYHKDGQFYGKTKKGRFMTEAEAQKLGARSAKASPIGKKKS